MSHRHNSMAALVSRHINPGQHFTGWLMHTIRKAVRSHNETETDDEIEIDNAQGNGTYGIYQARVRIKGDPRVYRMLLAPADAPITLKRALDIGDHFDTQLGED